MKNKEIIIISPSFYPDKIGISYYNFLKARYLSKKKYTVHVLTAMPYYPEWEIKKPYLKSPLFVREKLEENIFLYRIKMYVPNKPNAAKRIFQTLHFFLLSLRYIFSLPKNAKIFSVVPFTSTILTGLVLKYFRGGKLWCHIQDFEFDVAIETYNLRFIKKSLNIIDNYLLKKCDKISTISHSMVKKLKEKTGLEAYYFPNFIDINEFETDYPKHKFFSKTSKPNILYSGNIGEKQDWELFSKFCIYNKDKLNFTIVGNGTRLKWLKNKLDVYQNVCFYELVDSSNLPRLLKSFDAHILFQKKNVMDIVMPSKLLAMMASQKPCIVYGNKNSELMQVINTSAAGIYFHSDNIEEISDTTIDFLLNKNNKKENKNKTKTFLKEKFSLDKVMKKFIVTLDKI